MGSDRSVKTLLSYMRLLHGRWIGGGLGWIFLPNTLGYSRLAIVVISHRINRRLAWDLGVLRSNSCYPSGTVDIFYCVLSNFLVTVVIALVLPLLVMVSCRVTLKRLGLELLVLWTVD